MSIRKLKIKFHLAYSIAISSSRSVCLYHCGQSTSNFHLPAESIYCAPFLLNSDQSNG